MTQESSAPPVFVSPRFTSEKLRSGAIEDSIDIFEDRIKGWILDQARALLERPHSELAVLHLLLPYFESHMIYRTGKDSKDKSERFFKQGFLKVFPQMQVVAPKGAAAPADFPDYLASVLYDQARCGVDHDGMIRHRILLAYWPEAPISVSLDLVKGSVAAVLINPRRVLEEIEAHLQGYVTALRDPRNVELRERFNRAWELKHPPGAISPPPEALWRVIP